MRARGNDVFRGRNVSIKPHDLIDHTWMVIDAASGNPICIGSQEQALAVYDLLNSMDDYASMAPAEILTAAKVVSKNNY